MAEELGISLGGVKTSLEDSADIASREMVKTLDRILADLVATSDSGSLGGYKAERFQMGGKRITLRRSGVKIPAGAFLWAVTVIASEHHQALGLNVFNILDTGRKRLPVKAKDDSPYPLWGVQTGARIPGGAVRQPSGRFGIAQPAGDLLSAIRKEPRSVSRNIDLSQEPLSFTMGPIDEVAPLNLYKRAEKIARRRVRSLFPGVWSVVFVGDLEDVAGGQ
jgi:hypothetical protein